MPFLWEPSLPANYDGMNYPAKLPCFTASLLCPSRVARVSRLIGKSDTTANGRRWQVKLRRLPDSAPISQPPQFVRKPPQNARNATLCRVAFRCTALVTGPQTIPGWWSLPPCLFETFPAGHPFEGRCFGVRSCRVSSLIWAGRGLPRSRYITGTFLLCNPDAT